MVFGVRQSARRGYRVILLVKRETDKMKQSRVKSLPLARNACSEAARAKKAGVPLQSAYLSQRMVQASGSLARLHQ